MSTWNDLLEQVKSAPDQLDAIRKNCLLELSKKTGRNVITYYSGWLNKPHAKISTHINDEDKNGFMAAIRGLDRNKGLDLIIHTQGGEIAATESIIDYLKDCFYNDIYAVIPQIAMSGGTLMACACKKIIMGRQSNLGPIDPQIYGMSAHAIIKTFKIACRQMEDNPAVIPAWQPILSNYPPSMIADCGNAITWAKEMVIHNFKDTMFKDEPDKIKNIVDFLGTPDITKSHSRHLSAQICKDIGLKIDMMEDDQDLQDKILAIHHATMITLSHTSAIKIIENHNGQSFIKSARIV